MQKSFMNAFVACIMVIGFLACLPMPAIQVSPFAESISTLGDPILPPGLPLPPPPDSVAGYSVLGDPILPPGLPLPPPPPASVA